MVPKEKTVVGLVETVLVLGPKKSKKVVARIDTGAEKSSIDKSLAEELDLGPIIKHKEIKSASGVKIRPYIKARVTLAKRKFNFIFTIADRSRLKYQVLIGQNILRRGFIIDPLLHHKPTRIKK
tara:strand:- start:313 stop:684 length:372 start_codon:yes stop_codon:yes gene_type:complete